MPSNTTSSTKYQYGFHSDVKPAYQTERGLSREIVERISAEKNDPQWMRDFRVRAFEIFNAKKMPAWGPDLSAIDFGNIIYYAKPEGAQTREWKDVPKDIKKTFDKLGVPEAERKFFAGVGAQYDSETVYHNIQKNLEKQGIIFTDTGTALKKYPDLFRQYFGTVVPIGDNKFAALNSACWSGGSFIYVPKGVKVAMPLQAYFRINTKNIGQFERTLIIADEGSDVHYIEGCTAPVYTTDALHAAVVEIIAKKGSRVRYTTIQNWSANVYNLVTKRARAEENALVEWIDGNLGSKITMKYPSVFLVGRGARADILSVALAGKGQCQDAGAKVVHMASDTSSNIVSKSVAFGGGRTAYRGLAQVVKGAKNAKIKVRCDALILDKQSRSDTYPTMKIEEQDTRIEHEATVSRISEKELFYLKSRGFSETEAASLVVAGFFEPLAKILPADYALELNRLIEMEMENAIG
ncbi:Fe-S cluster assembly protein SufB [Candidatus Azambacteria bacterium RIFCSPHIGHO2_02_FULL_52_12]|uniref:Fe-S cluster assembly protein SufB n=1 Tax=Candidatus Azambacteria bacterium RIFCSPLOWO2_01_FULL_46_25 TaxID=1797298 RepID=A0A1F5BTI9_9BACT|nr:MAG: Fe-S cluster assembly protein SufB [Candidatus Azambacteria bacterium RIFCSPHIGHO2_02_FULL_52_12]OGD33905.1 MAG: Fe-S cluster assembly protein SufB [Candidatus Azambacteria bacterium RIFCSPLOWO2_01_FULL_46_25]OGD37150.1 MAG: Fe-S cluster assembly protein SufB [Candidatus Azambacteria bacterium RIFCSPHIGHO2_01_FULL_51_74]